MLEDHLGELRASCYLNVIPNLTRDARPYAVIENVITDEAMRGRGFGLEPARQMLAGGHFLTWDGREHPW